MAPSATAETQQSYSLAGGKPRQYNDGALVGGVDKHGDDPVTIRLSDEERKSGKTRPETVQALLTYYHRDGFVVLENAIDEDLVDGLYNRMVEDNAVFLEKQHVRWNQDAAIKNVSQSPPLTKEWLHRDFYANPHMIRVVENLLGPRPELRFINSNVAIPGGTKRQAVHSDVYHDYPVIPFGLVMNIYLQDSDAENGVTEVWCGTQNWAGQKEQQATPDVGWIKKDYIQERAKIRPPVQPLVKKGSICFRDLRLWHAGMPNRSDKSRIMLAVDYFAQWYQCPMPAKLPLSLKEDIERDWPDISTAGIEWVPGELDGLDLPFFLNMTQDPSQYLLQTERGVEDWKARSTGNFAFEVRPVSEQNYWTPE